MGRAGWALMVVAVVGVACGDSSPPTPTATPPPPPTTAAVTTTVTTMSIPTTTEPPRPGEALDAFLGAIAAGDAAGALGLLASDAVVEFMELELRLGAPLPEDQSWLPGVIGVGEATAPAVMKGLLDYYVALGTQPEVAGCREDGSRFECSYAVADAFTRIAGEPVTGTLAAEVDGGLIARLSLDPLLVSSPGWGPDEFKRWAAVNRPEVLGETTLLAWARAAVPVAAEWDAAGRPDAPAPPDFNTTDPVAVVRGWLDFRNIGDWVSTVALLGGGALDDPLASRQQFDAEEILEREISVSNCQVVLDDDQGTRLGCDVAVSDIVTRAAGIVATNPNQSTFTVLDGRIVDLPDFYPSSFRAEEAIEQWAQANLPGQYAAACPFGIAGQSPLETVSCARFVADNRAGWEPVLAELDS